MGHTEGNCHVTFVRAAVLDDEALNAEIKHRRAFVCEGTFDVEQSGAGGCLENGDPFLGNTCETKVGMHSRAKESLAAVMYGQEHVIVILILRSIYITRDVEPM